MTDIELFNGKSPLLSSMCQNQLVRAIERTLETRCSLWTNFIEPNLLDFKRGIHTPLVPRQKYAGWRHSHVEELLNSDASPEDILAQSPLFTMPLRIPRHLGGTQDGRELWTRPSERAVNGGFWVFTLEMDKPDIAALEQQLAWCRSPDGKPKNSLIGQLDQQLCTYRDYRGVTAIYSGSKSVHISFIFDIRHLDRKQVAKKEKWLGDVDDLVLPGLYRNRWHALLELVAEHFGPETEFDNQLSSLFQLRRTPGGIRTVDQGHILGLEPGTQVLQCVLLDINRTRTSPGATDWFIRPEHACDVEALVSGGTSRSATHHIEHEYSDQILIDLAEYLKMHWRSDYPKPVSIRNNGGVSEVRFLNDKNDRHPGTVVEGQYRRLLTRGRGAPTAPLYLPFQCTLDQTLNLLGVDSPAASEPSNGLTNNWWERTFTRRAHSKEEARTLLGALEKLLTSRSRYVWIKSVEGIGKTHTLLWEAPYRRLDRFADSNGKWEPNGFLVIACRSYEQAMEKCAAFNQIHAEARQMQAKAGQMDAEAGQMDAEARQVDAKARLFHGVVLQSFSSRYKGVCWSQKIGPLSRVKAVELGYPTLIAAAAAEHPDVFATVCQQKNEAWQHKGVPEASILDPLRTVIFTVHSVVQHWPYQRQSRTRAWLHPDYSDDLDDDQIKVLNQALTFSEIIYDEVGTSDLVHLYPESVVNWCEQVRRSVKSWDNAKANDRLKAYRSKTPPSGHPPVGFDECCRIISLRFTSDDLKAVDTDLYPFGNDHDEHGLYTGENGRLYYLRQQDWWRALGAKITFLTTEDLPTCIAEQLRWTNPDDSDRQHRFEVYRFDQTHRFIHETVPLVLDDRAAKDQKGNPKLKALIEDIRAIHPACKIITNNAPHEVTATLTHQKARGRNDLTRSDLVTVQQYLGPALYAELCLLGEVFQIDDVVRMHYRDELFQALGRNRGMRRPDQAPIHFVFMSNRLFRDLGQHSYTRGLRYQLVLRRLDTGGKRTAA